MYSSTALTYNFEILIHSITWWFIVDAHEKHTPVMTNWLIAPFVFSFMLLETTDKMYAFCHTDRSLQQTGDVAQGKVTILLPLRKMSLSNWVRYKNKENAAIHALIFFFFYFNPVCCSHILLFTSLALVGVTFSLHFIHTSRYCHLNCGLSVNLHPLSTLTCVHHYFWKPLLVINFCLKRLQCDLNVLYYTFMLTDLGFKPVVMTTD